MTTHRQEVSRAALAQAASHMQRQAQTYADHQRSRAATDQQQRARVSNSSALGVVADRLHQHYDRMTSK